MKEGWKYNKLGDIIDNLRTGLNPRVHFKLNTEDAKGYYVTVRELKGFKFEVDEKTDRINESAIQRINERSKLQLGDVLFSGTGSIGRTALVTEKPTWWNIKEGVYALTPQKEILDPKYLIYAFMSDVIMTKVIEKATGTTIKSIPMKELVKIELPVPPLPEQQEIVTYLDNAFAKIDAIKANAEKSLADAKALFQSALKEMMEPKEGWEEKTLSDIVDSDSAISYGIVQPGDDCINGVPVVRPVDLKRKHITLTDEIKRTSQANSDAYKRTLLNGKEILMCVRGTTGVVSLTDSTLEGCNVTRGIVPLKIQDETLRNFVYYSIIAPIAADFIQHNTRGAALKQINIADVKLVPISLPSIVVQQSIVTTLDTLSAKVTQLQQNYTRTLAECDALKQALLKQVFE